MSSEIQDEMVGQSETQAEVEARGLETLVQKVLESLLGQDEQGSVELREVKSELLDLLIQKASNQVDSLQAARSTIQNITTSEQANGRRIRIYLKAKELLVVVPQVAGNAEAWRLVKPDSTVEVVIANSIPRATRNELLASLKPLPFVYGRAADPGEFPVVAWYKNWGWWSLILASGFALATGAAILTTKNKVLCVCLGVASVVFFVSSNTLARINVLAKICECLEKLHGDAGTLPGGDGGAGGCGAGGGCVAPVPV